MKFDFDKICDEHPLPDVIQQCGDALQKDGNEFIGLCPFHSENTKSFTVYLDKVNKWKYHCFGCGAHGDAIDYIKEKYACKPLEAVEILTGERSDLKAIDRPKYTEANNPYAGYDIIKPPADTPPIKAKTQTPRILNPKRIDANGKAKVIQYTPSMVFPYRDRDGDLLGYVIRADITIGDKKRKLTPGVWWTVNKAANYEGWSHGSYPAPRPLYNLDKLVSRSADQVLIVEGEKCANAGERLFAGHMPVVSVSFMGGGKSLSKVDWRPLKGRSVLIWPDNDAEGWRSTMGYASGTGWTKGIVDYAFEAGAARIKIMHITAASRADGWDIADAEAEGLTRDAIALIIKDRVQVWGKERFDEWKQKRIAAEQPRPEPQPAASSEAPQPEQNAPPEQEQPPATPARPSYRGEAIAPDTWRQHLIMKADGDGLKSTSIQNAALMLQYERRFAGTFAWNEFAKEVFIMRRPVWDRIGNLSHWTPRKIIDTDVTSAACWLEYCGLSTKANDVGRVIQRVAQHNSYNPVTDRLRSLHWDGIARLNDMATVPWLSQFLGAENTTINQVFGMKYLVGAVARAFRPGCKMDTMIILEGPQGLRKSSALRTLCDAVGPNLFTDEISDPNSKDAGLQMQGAFIVEIAELDAFRRAEITQIKAWLSRQTDRFRRPYGKIVEEFPRSCVFAGTVNPSGTGYLKDPTGARRFEPVKCNEIKLDELAAAAPQLWAEAVALYDLGTTWWLEGEENALAEIVQRERYEEDPYGQMIDDMVKTYTIISTLQIMREMDIPMERRNAITNRRIAGHLHSKGWQRKITSNGIFYINPNQLDLTDIPQ